jgi:hypothetical protein
MLGIPLLALYTPDHVLPGMHPVLPFLVITYPLPIR